MRRVTRWFVLGAFCILAATACGDAFGIDDVLGMWETTSINGDPVPGIVVVEGESFDVQYYRWTFVDGGQCSVAADVDGEVESMDDCDYTVNIEQETIAITFFDIDFFQGSINGDRMTLTDDEGVILVLRRQ